MNRAAAIDELATVIGELHLGHPICVAIDGRDGAGKSVLGDELVVPLTSFGRQVIRASIDGFHHPKRIRYARGRYSSEGYFADSFDYDAFRALLLSPLRPGGSRRYRTAVFDYRQDAAALAPERRAADDAILLADGIFLLRPELIQYWDFKIFVEVSAEISVVRCVVRDGTPTDTDDPHNRRYLEAHEFYLERCSPRDRADVIFVNDDLFDPAILWNPLPRST